ncbi:thioesterase family protein [Dactylosporangium matsuzakiense]|uniref:Acyl-CoA thioesterase FadM n=1 Tax=Dactylosporangium matsuzakiense TaxID=53360 RepID=A0A9W6KH33_9ACTN|nr:thioesterase family protein [Dactylosporangium matsuzakiense]UWZ42472.1 thioesterase [Dactylosporangium matsuzakiense]GLL00615.1 hypothetical protein GCM10017581_023560 [Dactylosporangium matsuzakiense]
MTATLSAPPATPLAAGDTVVDVRPRYEGSNICTWIGFKHVNYMVEDAVLSYFREHGYAAGTLYERYGLCVDLVDIDSRILHAFHIDDLATAVVSPRGIEGGQLKLRVELFVERDGKRLKATRSTVGVSLRLDPRGWDAEPVPAELAPIAVDRLGTGGAHVALPAGADPIQTLIAGQNATGWSSRMRYFYCHFTERLQMSGYLRQMEEVLDRFMEDRGRSIKLMLDEQNWIPVVPQNQITILDECKMEEDLYTVFVVEDVYKRLTFTARMDTYVKRGDTLIQTATGKITHGWAVIENRRDWSLVDFDDALLAVVSGTHADGSK